MEAILKLAEFGIAGVAIALVIAIIIIVKSVLKLVGNHMSHNTEANTKLAESIRDFMRMVKDFHIK